MRPPVTVDFVRALAPRDLLDKDTAGSVYAFLRARCGFAHTTSMVGTEPGVVCVCGTPYGGPSGRPYCVKLCALREGGDEESWVCLAREILDETDTFAGQAEFGSLLDAMECSLREIRGLRGALAGDRTRCQSLTRSLAVMKLAADRILHELRDAQRKG